MKIFILTMLFISATLSLCNENKTFYERIDVFQSDIKELCSHIENESLDKAKKFLYLMNDARIECPEETSLKVKFENVAANAKEYFHFVEDKLRMCKELEDLVSGNGLFSNGLLGFYVRNGNYTLARNITQIWHQSFIKFSTKFIPIDIPLEIIAHNSDVFFFKKWNTIECIISWIFLILLLKVVPNRM